MDGISFCRLLTLVIVGFMIATDSRAQTTTESPRPFGESSTYGREFITGFMQNIGGTILTKLELVIGTPADSVPFVVETFDTEIHRGTVTSDSPVVVEIPSNLDFQVLGSDFFERQKGLRITSTTDDPIFVLGANFIDLTNYGTFLAYPCELDFELDTYEYRIMSIGDTAFYSQFLLVACSDDTLITIIPTQTIEIPEDAQAQNSPSVNIPAGTGHNITLHELNTFLVFSERGDLSGTRILSNKPLTVIGGHECANVPQGAFECEPIAVQIPPVVTWGTNFLIAGYAGRTSEQLQFSIVPSEQNTTLEATCGDSTIFLFQTRFEFAVSSDEPFCHFRFSKPVFLAQLASGRSTDNLGDPAIAIISPIDQYINRIVFVLLPTEDFPASYISITVPAEHYDPDSILLDGTVVNCEWMAINNRSNDIVGYGCNVTMPAQSSTTPTQHTLSHSDPSGRISATVYGFRNFPAQGYAYLVGQKLEITDITDGDGIDIDDLETLDFIDVTNFDEVQELRREEDAFSDPIYIPNGMLYGERTVTSAYVNENGIISFNERWKYSHPERFPTRNFNIRSRGLAVSPFWSDADIRRNGTVRYATTSISSRNRREIRELFNINQFVNSRLLDENSDVPFRGTWMLVAHWDKVHPSPHGAEDHLGIPEEELDKTNNFQAIVVTNVSHTFTIFNYVCGGLQWSGFGRDKALVGYIASGGIYSNHPSSGSASVGEIISCSFEINNKRRKRQMNPMPRPLPVEIPGDPEEQMRIRLCTNTRERNNLLFIRTGINPPELATELEPCPPTEGHARRDFGRFIRFSDDPLCYVAGRPMRINRLPQLSITQQCCYEFGNLVSNRVTGYVGRMLLYHPMIDDQNYMLFDQEYRQRCCALESGNFCDEYFEQRPINEGEGYQPPVLGAGYNDPNYRTFDRRYYDFQGLGDYSSFDALDDEGNIVFSLQGRQRQISGGGVTWHTALAFGQPNVIAYQFGETPGFRVFQTAPTDSRREITDELVQGVPRYDDLTLSMLMRRGNTLTAAFYESGVALTACLRISGSRHWINWNVQVPHTYDNQTQGLLGNLDGDPNNDFRLRDGIQLSGGIGHQDLFNQYVESWRILPINSMFSDASRKKRGTTTEEPFVPVFFDQLTFTDEQSAICEGDEQCLLNLLVTNDMEVGILTLEEQRTVNTTTDQFENLAPNISGSGTFRVNLREESIYTIKVVDPGDNFTVGVQGGLPPNSVLEELGDGEYTFKWSLQELTNEPLVFVATDTRNASSTHTPIVEVCACANDGVCTVDGLLTTNSTITMACICSEGFSGQFCEEDRNGCGEIQCYEGVECLDVPAPGIGAVCGACPLGFTGDGLKCYDVDECALNSTLCNQHCNNTDGSYFCDCFQGYRIRQGMSKCEDVNECDENLDECQQQCINTIGFYVCSCDPGFSLDSDERSCVADQPCDDGGGCSHICAVVSGQAQCYCPLGLQLIEGTQCVDINECLVDSPCDQVCSNTLGSFECSCRDGYTLLEDERKCEDIDECTDAALNAIDLCENDQNTECFNNEGSFECVCVPGFSRTNGTCQRIIEEPPPPPPPVVPPKGIESSVSFISPTLTLSDFTPERQQLFRRITALAVTNFCSKNLCTVVLLDGKSETEQRPEGSLQAQPQNVAIPSGLVSEDESGQLNITFYVQFDDGFLAMKDLTSAVQESEEQYRNAAFLQQAPFPPTDVQGFCDVVVWSLLVQPGGEIFAYDIRLYIPGTEEVIVNLGNKNFYIIQDDIILIPRTSILVQVRGINAVGAGEWSSPTSLGCADPPTVQPPTCPPTPTCPVCPTCQVCPTCATCPTTPECPTCETCPSPTTCPGCPTQPACPTCETPPPCPTCETCPTLPPCPTCETCPTQPACPTCSTETCPPCVCETEQPIPAIHFELNGMTLLNNSVIDLQSVGTNEKALFCVTDLPTCCGSPFRAGQFYFPNNQPVPNMAANLGFWRGRGARFIRLNRREDTTSPPGSYRCEIPDASGALQNIYITLK